MVNLPQDGGASRLHQILDGRITPRLPQAAGIYAMRNKATGQMYVGSSINIRARWANHLYRLRCGTHHAPRLQRTWNKVGSTGFTIEILELLDSPQHLREIETAWIAFLHAHTTKGGYNNVPTGQSTAGHTFTAEQRAAISERGYKTAKPYVVTYPDGKVQTIKNLGLFCAENGLQQSAMRSVAACKQLHHKGFLCRKASMPLREWEAGMAVCAAQVAEGMARGRRGAGDSSKSTERRQAMSQRRVASAKPHVVTHPDGREEIVLHLNDFCAAHGITPAGMYHCAVGRKASHKGWKCRKYTPLDQ